MSDDDALEVALLQHELRALEAQIASYTTSPPLQSNPPAQQQQHANGTATSLDTAAVWGLLRDNDEELEREMAALGNGNEEDDGEEDGGREKKRRKMNTAGVEEELKKAERLGSLNAAFTGFSLSPSSSSRLLSSPSPTTFLRRHTVHGSWQVASIEASCEFDVLERVPEAEGGSVEEEGKRRAVEADYQVVRMEGKVSGKGVVRMEVDRWVTHCSRLRSPPLFFRSMRIYSILAHERAQVLASLAKTHSNLIRHGRPPQTSLQDWLGETSLTFSEPKGAALLLTFSILFDASGTPSPVPTLTARLPRDPRKVPAIARALAAEVPRRFEEMLADGHGLEVVVGLMVEVFLGPGSGEKGIS